MCKHLLCGKKDICFAKSESKGFDDEAAGLSKFPLRYIKSIETFQRAFGQICPNCFD